MTPLSSTSCHSSLSMPPQQPPSYPADGASFEFKDKSREFNVVKILSELTSPVIYKFILDVPKDLSSENLLLCFRFVCSLNVELIKVRLANVVVPSCVFQCQTLVSLDLEIVVDCHLYTNTIVRLPNLKKLRLVVGRLIELISELIRCCPLLEDLYLCFEYDAPFLRILSPNLKSLYLHSDYDDNSYNEIIIDAPQLEYLRIRDCNSLLRFVNDPKQLLTADINLDPEWENDDDDDPWSEDFENRQIAEFLQCLSSVRNLRLFGDMRLFSYLDLVVSGSMPIFHNLTFLETNLKNGYSGLKDLLLSLQCAPNLEDLQLAHHSLFVDLSNWFAPEFLPSKLKRVKINLYLRGDDEKISILEHFLSCAIVLEQLHIEVRYIEVETHEARVAKEYKLCKDLFTLPRSSSTSEIVFSGEYIFATSNAIKDGLLDGKIQFRF